MGTSIQIQIILVFKKIFLPLQFSAQISHIWSHFIYILSGSDVWDIKLRKMPFFLVAGGGVLKFG